MGYTLAGAALFSIVASLTHTRSIAVPQALSAAITAVLAAGVAKPLLANATPETTFATVIVTLAVTAIVTGLISITLGAFQLGDLVRSVPYPIVGAFFVSIGWLIVDGAFALATGATLHIERIENLFTPEAFGIWVPGLTLALLLIGAIRITDNLLIVPIVLLGGLGLFYGIIFILDISVADAQKATWLHKPFTEQILPDPAIINQIQIFAIGE